MAPFNLAAALLVIGAGIAGGPAAYGLWAAAIAIQAFSPLFIRVRGRFAIQPSHFAERHGALVIIVLGESVVDIGIGAEGHAVTVSLALAASAVGVSLSVAAEMALLTVILAAAVAAESRAAASGGPGGRPPETSTSVKA